MTSEDKSERNKTSLGVSLAGTKLHLSWRPCQPCFIFRQTHRISAGIADSQQAVFAYARRGAEAVKFAQLFSVFNP
jgi:hypothetical protein